jgi:hypothetical protein
VLFRSNQEQFLELMRLRGEVSLLRKQLAEMTKKRKAEEKLAVQNPNPNPATPEPESAAMEEEKRQAILKMNNTKNWLLAFMLFADKNNNKLPADFTQAIAFVPEETRAELTQAAAQFDIVYHGALSEITNPPPSQTILLREKQAWQSVNGNWAKTYGFADGHSEVHISPDGSFENWESERLQRTGQ